MAETRLCQYASMPVTSFGVIVIHCTERESNDCVAEALKARALVIQHVGVGTYFYLSFPGSGCGRASHIED
eukprot:scaffold7082_cov144-Skeletonema_marinoi.AAC.3